MGKLTVKFIEAVSEPGRYSDDDGTGFHLRVDTEGRKYYILRTQIDGKRKDFAIGSAKKLKLSEAREAARKKRIEVEGAGARGGLVPDFAHSAELAHKARTVGYRNEKHVEQWISTLRTHANPVIGTKAIDEVSTADVIKVLEPIWLKTPETARRVLQRIDRVMRWAVGNNHRLTRIDMTLVRDALPRQPRKRLAVRRMPSLAWEEMPEFWEQIPLLPSIPILRLAMQLLVLTAVRPGNIRKAKRSQFDLVRLTWVMPGDEMKTGEAFRVALSPAAGTVVKHAMRLHDHELLFAVNGEEMSQDTLRMMLRRFGREETPHGFRSTFKEWARAQGWADHLSEAALAHQDPNEVRAAYARSDLLEERRPMMAAWASYLAGGSDS